MVEGTVQSHGDVMELSRVMCGKCVEEAVQSCESHSPVPIKKVVRRADLSQINCESSRLFSTSSVRQKKCSVKKKVVKTVAELSFRIRELCEKTSCDERKDCPLVFSTR